MSNPNTALVKSNHEKMKDLVRSDKFKDEMAQVATRHLPPDRLARIMLSAATRNPKIMECTPTSILQCGMACSQFGIEPDGRHAHLVPYGNQCTLIIDYKGLITLARRNGAKSIAAECIYSGDEFTYYRDESGVHFRHVPKFGTDRGDIIGAYAQFAIDGEMDIEVMDIDEIESTRRKSRSPDSGPWREQFGEMAKKTVLRRGSKRWPIAPQVQDLLDIDGEFDPMELPPPQKSGSIAPPFTPAGTITEGEPSDQGGEPEGEPQQEPAQPPQTEAPKRRGRPPGSPNRAAQPAQVVEAETTQVPATPAPAAPAATKPIGPVSFQSRKAAAPEPAKPPKSEIRKQAEKFITDNNLDFAELVKMGAEVPLWDDGAFGTVEDLTDEAATHIVNSQEAILLAFTGPQ